MSSRYSQVKGGWRWNHLWPLQMLPPQMLMIDRPQSSYCTKSSTFLMSRGCACGFQTWHWIDCYVAVLLVWHFAAFWRQSLQFHSRGLWVSGFGCRCHCCAQAHLFPSCLFSLSSGGLLNWISTSVWFWVRSADYSVVDVCGCRGMLADLSVSQLYDALRYYQIPITLLTDIKASDKAS